MDNTINTTDTVANKVLAQITLPEILTTKPSMITDEMCLEFLDCSEVFETEDDKGQPSYYKTVTYTTRKRKGRVSKPVQCSRNVFSNESYFEDVPSSEDLKNFREQKLTDPKMEYVDYFNLVEACIVPFITSTYELDGRKVNATTIVCYVGENPITLANKQLAKRGAYVTKTMSNEEIPAPLVLPEVSVMKVKDRTPTKKLVVATTVAETVAETETEEDNLPF